MLVIDTIDQDARFPIAYGWQPVRGWPIKHYDIVGSQSTQRVKQNALAEGPWDALEKLWADAFEIDPADFSFHPGDANDAPDTIFPDEPPHPWISYINARCLAGLSNDQTDKLFGIYRTLRTPNYNGAGQQLNSVGTVVAPSDPRTEYFFKPNPANCAIDQLLRWGKRPTDIVNFPAWVDWRDYNDELIPWDNTKYSPRNLSVTPTSGGTLTPGTTYIARVVTLRGADISSASRKSVEHPANPITLLGGQTAFQVNWLIKGDETNPATFPIDITGYRVYVGTVVAGVDTWSGYFSVGSPAARTLLVTTLAGVTAGVPPDTATAGLLVNIKRFECGLFVLPPYDLGTMLDRICQISCADWQWSGLGTGTYRNDKIRFMSPANRAPVFTLNHAETGLSSFKTYPVDRRSRPNEIVVNFRDRDSPYLEPAQPVRLPRELMQEDEGQVKVFTIEGGTMYRSQAQRCASFYARVMCDMDQIAVMKASPKSYFLLPGDVVNVTNTTPDWTDQKFVVRKKEEQCEGGMGDQVLLQLYIDNLYSDTDYAPLPRPLPAPKFNPFAAPPIASGLTLTQVVGYAPDMSTTIGFAGNFVFDDFGGPQFARVFLKGPAFGPTYTEPSDATYKQIEMIAKGDSATAGWTTRGLVAGKYWVKVVTESNFGSSLSSGHPVASITLQQAPPAVGSFPITRISTNWLLTWTPGQSGAFLPETYILRVRDASTLALKRTATIQVADWLPAKWALEAGGTGDVSKIHMDPDGSIYSDLGLAGHLNYTSQVFSGDADVEWTVDDRIFTAMQVVDNGTFNVTASVLNGLGIGALTLKDIVSEVAIDLAKRLPPLGRIKIRVGNQHPDYYINDTYWMRGYHGPTAPIFYLRVQFLDEPGDPAFHYTQAYKGVKVRPKNPRQFVYTNAMATLDFPLGIPATIRFDITQISEFGIESPVTTVVI